MRKYEVLLFDFDGTLFDTWPAIYEAYLTTYRHFNPGKSTEHIAKIQNRHGDYVAVFKEVFQVSEFDKQIEKYLHSTYLACAVKSSILFNGVQEVIDLLEEKGYRWGIVSNKKQESIKQIIECSVLSKNYECLICEEDVTHKKPHPEPLLKACNILGIPPIQALYIGDAVTDIEAANAAGMDGALALYGYIDDQEAAMRSKASYYISDIRELPLLLSSAIS